MPDVRGNPKPEEFAGTNGAKSYILYDLSNQKLSVEKYGDRPVTGRIYRGQAPNFGSKVQLYNYPQYSSQHLVGFSLDNLSFKENGLRRIGKLNDVFTVGRSG